MKKTLTLAFCISIMLVGMQTAFASDTDTNYTKSQKSTSVEKRTPPKFERGKMPPPKMNLEEDLGLTESQKQQARQNRIQGRKEMKPVMDEIRAKKEAVLDIMDSDLSDEKKQEQIKAIQGEIKALHKKANELRNKNMQEFEKILTKDQKAKFEQMKIKKHQKHKCKKCNFMPPPPMENE